MRKKWTVHRDVANERDFEIGVTSSNSRSITFTFALIILGKVWNPLSSPSYVLSSAITVFFMGGFKSPLKVDISVNKI